MKKLDTNNLENNNNLKTLSNFIEYNNILIGGAVVDLLENKKPKDYDFLITNPTSLKIDILKLMDEGFKYISDSRTAITLCKDTTKVQFVKIQPEFFDYTISQANYNINSKRLSIDRVSFDNKLLIPVNYEKRNVISSLQRLPHWQEKGYTLPRVTYNSLLNVLTNTMSKES